MMDRAVKRPREENGVLPETQLIDAEYKRWGVAETGVVPNSAPCQIMHPLVLVGLGVGVGEGLGLGVGLGLGNQVAISTRGCIIWQGCRFRHNTGAFLRREGLTRWEQSFSGTGETRFNQDCTDSCRNTV